MPKDELKKFIKEMKIEYESSNYAKIELAGMSFDMKKKAIKIAYKLEPPSSPTFVEIQRSVLTEKDFCKKILKEFGEMETRWKWKCVAYYKYHATVPASFYFAEKVKYIQFEFGANKIIIFAGAKIFDESSPPDEVMNAMPKEDLEKFLQTKKKEM